MSHHTRAVNRPRWRRAVLQLRAHAGNKAMAHAFGLRCGRAVTWAGIAYLADKVERSPFARSWKEWLSVLDSYREVATRGRHITTR